MPNCGICKRVKPLSDFYIRKSGVKAGKPRHECKECSRIKTYEWRTNNRERRAKYERDREHADPDRVIKYRKHLLKKFWNLSLDDYTTMLREQHYGCAICSSQDPGGGRINFCVDHDHNCCPGNNSCGKCIRGLLCLKCNRALGLISDSSSMLMSAACYLQDYAEKRVGET